MHSRSPLLALLVVYSLVAMVFSTAMLPRLSSWLVPVFYAVMGLAWVPIAMAIVSWMYRGRPDETVG